MKLINKISKLVIAIAITSSISAQAEWRRDDPGNYTTGSTVLNSSWSYAADALRTNDILRTGVLRQCSKGAASPCSYSFSEAWSVAWAWSIGTTTEISGGVKDVYGIKQAVTTTLSKTTTSTTTETDTITVKPGQTAQFHSYMPRRFGFRESFGVMQDKNKSQYSLAPGCTRPPGCTLYLYEWNSGMKAAYTNGHANQKNVAIWTWAVNGKWW